MISETIGFIRFLSTEKLSLVYSKLYLDSTIFWIYRGGVMMLRALDKRGLFNIIFSDT